MPTITIDVPVTADLTRAVDAFCAKFGYQATIGGSPNPETKNQFAKRMLANYCKQVVREYEASLAMETARTAAESSANALNIT